MVHELEKEFGTRMTFKIIDYQAEGSPEQIAAYGLEEHGMVLVDRDGATKWSESGHNMTKDDVATAIRSVLDA